MGPLEDPFHLLLGRYPNYFCDLFNEKAAVFQARASPNPPRSFNTEDSSVRCMVVSRISVPSLLPCYRHGPPIYMMDLFKCDFPGGTRVMSTPVPPLITRMPRQFPHTTIINGKPNVVR